MRRAPVRAFVAALASVLAPAVAEAHLTVSGLGPLYDGAAHAALDIQDLAPLVALGLFAGRRGPRPSRLALAVLPAAWIAGAVIALTLGAPASAEVSAATTAGLLLLVGGLLAADAPLGPLATAALATGVGLARGGADLAGVTPTDGTWLSIAGLGGCVFVIFALAVSITLPLRRFWMIVAARVAGSWIAAAGLLLAGWILRYGARVQ